MRDFQLIPLGFDNSATIPDLWSARITHFLTRFSAFLPNATRAWEGDAVYGNTVKIPTIDRSVTVSNYSRTADLAAPEDIDTTTQDLNIDQEKYFRFFLEDLNARQDRIGAGQLIDSKAQGAGIAMAENVDEYVGGLLAAIGNNDFAHQVAAAAFNLNFLTEVKKQATFLNQPQSSLIAITTPEVIQKIENGVIDKTYGDVVTAANWGSGASDDPVVTGMGYALTIGGIRIYVSNSTKLRAKANNAAVDANSRGTISRCFVYDPMDLALVMQVNKVETSRMEARFATQVKGLMNYGSKVLNAGRMQRYLFND